MDNSNTNAEGLCGEETMIPCELIKEEIEVMDDMQFMEIDEKIPVKMEEVQENNVSDPSPQNVRNFETCYECGIRAHCIVQKKNNGRVAYFCTENCMVLNSYQTTPRFILPHPKVQPSQSARMQIINATSFYVRVCCSCSAVIQLRGFSKISWQSREFCNEKCLTKHQLKYNSVCFECERAIPNSSNFGKFSMKFGNNIRSFCTKDCLDKYKITLNMCQFCNSNILKNEESRYLAPIVELSSTFKEFCSDNCVRSYCHYKLKLPLQNDEDNYAICVVCRTFKFVQFKFRNKNVSPQTFCSELCFGKFQFYNKIDVMQCFICKILYEKACFQRYCLYDNGVKNFCTEKCEITYHIITRRIVDCHNCKVRKYNFDMIQKTFPNNKTIYTCCFHCLKISYRNMTRPVLNTCNPNDIKRLYENLKNLLTLAMSRNGGLARKQNVSTICYPMQKDASTSTESLAEQKDTQTISTNVIEFSAIRPTPAPKDVQAPLQVTVPVPVPIPVPIFVSTVCKTQEDVSTKLTQICEEMPQDPLQTDLIMLAETLDVPKEEVPEKKPPTKLKCKRKLKRTMKRNMVKKYRSFGFNSLKRWIFATNAQIKNEAESKSNEFKTNLLFMTKYELQNCLIAFLKEIKSGNSADTVYTIFLDIQKHLLEHNKQEYIFLDPSYKKFIELFNELAVDSHNTYKINTKLTEDFLWKTNQLGTHTPYTLLYSLIYFNCKLFGLKTVQEHFDLLSAQLTFIIKPKLNISEKKVKYIYRLKYFPKIVSEHGEKKMSEIEKQFYNEKRCPGILFEFYIKKCPAIGEHYNKNFYLKPELTCETDSPIWFSKETLDKTTIEMMLNQIKMVKEIYDV